MLSPTQRAMIQALLEADPVPTRQLVDAIYGARLDGGPDGAEPQVRKQVHLMRAKLAEIGAEIETVGRHGRGAIGYRVKPEHVAIVRSALAITTGT